MAIYTFHPLVLARIILIPATFKITGVPKMGTSVKPVSLAASRQEIFLDSVSAPCRALAPPMGGLGGLGSSDGHSVLKVLLGKIFQRAFAGSP